MMDAVAFGNCRGWLHDAAGGRGIVICSAWGFEELCSRSALAWLARRLAASGAPTLRFDFGGTCDSGDSTDPESLVAAFTADARAAADMLRRRCGVAEIAVVGLRLGAAIAALAARDMAASRLALLAPAVFGRSYAREMRAMARMSRGPDGGAVQVAAEADAAGFVLPGRGFSELRDLDLTRLSERPSDKCLIVGADATPGLSAFAACLSDLGAKVERADFNGYDEMMCDPTAAQIPSGALSATAEWLLRGASVASRRQLSYAPAPPVLRGADWEEETAALPHGLVGVYCRPTQIGAARRAALFLNAGAIHHIGWARMNVDMARALASLGAVSLRFDCAGVGDSAPPSDAPFSLFSPDRRKEIGAAIDWLFEQGLSEIVLVGACSGAHHAFHIASGDRRVTAAILVNMPCIIWGPSHAMQFRAWRATKTAETQARGFAAQADESQARLAALSAIALPLAKRFARKSFGALKTLSALANAGLRRSNAVEQKFRGLDERGARIDLVYSAADPGLDELARYLGPEGERLAGFDNIAKTIIPDADHTLTQKHARETLFDIVRRSVSIDAELAPSRAA